jgi:AraC family transcriptional regulator
MSLDEISRASGASSYHFIRVFSAYMGETPFSYIRRERVAKSLELLQSEESITEIAMNVGFETSSSFNKAFKKITNLSPSEFRNLGKAQKENLFYDVYVSPKTKEIIMNIEMEMKPEVIKRSETTIYSFSADDTTFKDAAQVAWQEFLKIIPTVKEDLSQSEFLGVGEMSGDTCSYRAAISIPTNPNAEVANLIKEDIPASKYAKFLLKGSYDGIWYAFDKAFKFINESEFEISSAPCLELYLNDPNTTPENELLTEILIPIN